MGRILFFPYPGGYGPLSNCMALADALIEHQQVVAFAYAGHNLPLLKQAKCTILPIKWPPPGASSRPQFSDKPFKTLSTYDDFACMFMLNDPHWLRLYLAEQLRVVDEWQPDVLVGSWTFTLGLVGRLRHIPVVHIYQAPMHPTNNGFQWWLQEKSEVEQRSLAALNDLLEEYGQPAVPSVEALLSTGDLLLIPALPEIEPIPGNDPRIQYIGHLVWQNLTNQPGPPWLDDILASEARIVFVYEGGARYGPRLYHALIEIFAPTDTHVVIATGMETPVALLPRAPANIHYEPFVPAFAIASKSCMILSHGGHGTTVLSLFCGLPSIIMPTNSEREYYARRLATAGTAIHLPFEQVNAMTLGDAIHRLASDGRYALQAERLGKKVRQLGGPAGGAKLIMQLLSC